MFRTAYDGLTVSGLSFEGEDTLTEQSHQMDCDVSNILAKFSRTGILERSTDYKAQFGDYLDVQDYHTSLNQINGARALFDALPAKVRARFNNDPGRLLDFCGDEKNLNEMYDLGLAERPVQTREITRDSEQHNSLT